MQNISPRGEKFPDTEPEVTSLIVIWVMKDGTSVDLRLQQTPTDFAASVLSCDYRLRLRFSAPLLLLLSFDLKDEVDGRVSDAP